MPKQLREHGTVIFKNCAGHGIGAVNPLSSEITNPYAIRLFLTEHSDADVTTGNRQQWSSRTLT